MGTFTTGGIAAEMAKFELLRRRSDEAYEKAVKAGADVLVERLKEAAPVYHGKRHDVKPGELRDSIKAGKVTYNAGDGYHCEVAPMGKNARGESLAMIGNILEYGRSGARTERRARLTEEEKEIRKQERRASRGGKKKMYFNVTTGETYWAVPHKYKVTLPRAANHKVKEEVKQSKYYSNMDKRGWFNDTVAGAENEVIQAMRNAFNEVQNRE